MVIQIKKSSASDILFFFTYVCQLISQMLHYMIMHRCACLAKVGTHNPQVKIEPDCLPWNQSIYQLYLWTMALAFENVSWSYWQSAWLFLLALGMIYMFRYVSMCYLELLCRWNDIVSVPWTCILLRTTLILQVVKVADFGVARVKDQSGVMTAETGTYRWMAPEVDFAKSMFLNIDKLLALKESSMKFVQS